MKEYLIMPTQYFRFIPTTMHAPVGESGTHVRMFLHQWWADVDGFRGEWRVVETAKEGDFSPPKLLTSTKGESK